MMRFAKYIILIILTVVVMPADAIKSTDAADGEQLIKQGHSEDMARIVELQKARLEPEKPEHKEFNRSNRFMKFFKNLFFEKDITMPLENFGQDRVRTVESPER